MASNNQSGNQDLCPHCKQPLSPGVKFCETCGAKVEQPATCPHCKQPLSPGVKFCEACGKAVAAAPSPAPAATTAPVPVPEPEPVSPPVEPARTAAPATVSPEPEPEKAPEQEPQPEPEPAPAPQPAVTTTEPEEKQAPAGSDGTASPASVTSPGTSQKTIIIAGIIGLVVIVAVAWFFVLPMFSGSGTPASGNGIATAGTTPATPGGTTATSAQAAAAVSLEPQPTQRMPANLEVIYQIERNPRNGLVTITFAGGPGLNGISEVKIRVTSADGNVLPKSWKPARVGDSVSIQGTVQDTRVEVITNFYNGDSYRNFDQVFEYQKTSY